VRNKQLFVDTSNAWNEIKAPTIQEIEVGDRAIDIRVIVDRGSVEVFADGGAISVTNLVWIETAFMSVQPHGAVTNLTLKGLKPSE
jgi:sucrose-6-phosphate hydrolase SacC (GH32 family)